MDAFAVETAQIREELFTQAAAQMSVPPIIIEKDFWVCWTLKRLFASEDVGAGLIFKGGTSLSKAYGAISRFSEDVDLSLDRHDLGFTDERDPANNEISNNARKRLLSQLTETCTEIVQGRLRDQIMASMQAQLPDVGFTLTVSDNDAQTLIFDYPQGVPPPPGGAYLQDKVKLEFGARSDHLPAQTRLIKAYAAQEFPDQIRDAEVSVKTLAVERTFWEKATILHMLYYQSEDKDLGKFMSRHFYDLAELARQDVRVTALADIELLNDVALHKSRFFPAAWARYDLAGAKTLKLTPNDNLREKLRADYRNMREMIFGQVPEFDDIMDIIAALEAEINAL